MPARFVTCHCGKHGRSVLADGLRGPEVCFKQAALHVIRSAISFEKATDEEAAKMTEEVLRSSLPQTPDEVELRLLYLVECFNQGLMALGETADPVDEDFPAELVHLALSGQVAPDDIPKDFLSAVKTSALGSVKLN